MNSIERRENILEFLLQTNNPIKGNEIAEKYKVTRQVIVKDIAILRAEGNSIIATPDGYIINRNNGKIKTIIAVNHTEDQMFDEMATIVKFGGIIEDVIVEHPIYGEIKGMLMVTNQNELEKFCSSYRSQKAKLLSVLTNGIHLHTIAAESKDNIELIINELKRKNYIISD